MIPNHIRAFIAIEIPRDIHEKIAQIINTIDPNKSLSLRWIQTHNIHLTLKFLGDIPISHINQIHALLIEYCKTLQQFDLTIRGIGAFPNAHRPRIIWLGIEVGHNLRVLQAMIENALFPLGYQKEERNFSPHLTIGRVQKSAKPNDLEHISSSLNAVNINTIGTFSVNGIKLFKSTLKPEGAYYDEMWQITFGDKLSI